jgi:hypothetical protein
VIRCGSEYLGKQVSPLGNSQTLHFETLHVSVAVVVQASCLQHSRIGWMMAQEATYHHRLFL